MNPRMAIHGSFRVLGVVSRVRRGSESAELFARIWRAFESHKEKIEPLATERAYVGVSFPTAEEAVTDYLAGMRVPAGAGAPEGLEARTIPEGEFAVFECPVEAIGETYRRIFAAWLPNAAVEFDATRPAFEEYRGDAPAEPVRLHIPVRQRLVRGEG